tara:strand:+ start:333 stop:884 length:552 start_codon:yes stop_codon:yes gene_type:complete
MACILTGGRLKPCKDAVGGLRKLYFVDFGSLGDVTLLDDEITEIAGTFTYYEYDIKGNSELTQNVNSSTDNGTTFFEQVLSATFTKLTKEDNKELKLMAYGRPHVFAEDYKGNVMCVGLENGADVTAGTAVTGTAMGDLNGYTLALTGNEVFYANFVDPTLNVGGFLAAISGVATAGTQRDPA